MGNRNANSNPSGKMDNIAMERYAAITRPQPGDGWLADLKSMLVKNELDAEQLATGEKPGGGDLFPAGFTPPFSTKKEIEHLKKVPDFIKQSSLEILRMIYENDLPATYSVVGGAEWQVEFATSPGQDPDRPNIQVMWINPEVPKETSRGRNFIRRGPRPT